MKRRTFIKRSSAATVPVMLGGVKVSALNNPFFNLLDGDDRVLVLIQLDGGNDGLNMLVPKDQYANLQATRPNVVVPESSILDLTDTLGFHPVMGDLKNVFDQGKLNIVQNVGYPNQNRSHFRSMDIWQTASEENQFLSTGWLGRYFNLIAPDYPTGYPNAENPDPFALTIGSAVNETCEGTNGSFSLALVDPENITALNTPISNTIPGSCYGDKLDFLSTTIIQSNAYGSVIESANESGNNLSTKYSDTNTLAEKLKLVARLISGGLQTKVYIVSLGGFDTHSDQVVDGNNEIGEHATLLATLSEAICAFQNDLELLGLEQRVVGMTYSEFGRRISSNASLGTDHGNAAPMMLFGTCVNSTIIGDNPIIPEAVNPQEGVPMQYDFRSVYGSVLIDWFGLDTQTVKELLYEDFQHIPVLENCQTTSTNPVLLEEEMSLKAYPNPFGNFVNLEFMVPAGPVKISLFDVLGHEIKVISNQRYSSGTHQMKVETHQLTPGTYFYHIQTEAGRKVERVVKL